MSLLGVPLWGGQGGGSVSAPSLPTKPSGVGAGIPGEAFVGLHLDILPTYKAKIKAWSQLLRAEVHQSLGISNKAA